MQNDTQRKSSFELWVDPINTCHCPQSSAVVPESGIDLTGQTSQNRAFREMQLQPSSQSSGLDNGMKKMDVPWWVEKRGRWGEDGGSSKKKKGAVSLWVRCSKQHCFSRLYNEEDREANRSVTITSSSRNSKWMFGVFFPFPGSLYVWTRQWLPFWNF